MSSWMNWFGGRKDTRESARDAIVNLRQQLLMIEKKEAHYQTKIDDEMKKARANATTNKRRECGPGVGVGGEGEQTGGAGVDIPISAHRRAVPLPPCPPPGIAPPNSMLTPSSGYRCAEAEEGVRERARQAGGHALDSGDTGVY